MNPNILNILKKHGVYVALLTLSVILFGLSFPGYFHHEGLAYLAFIALVPMFYVAFRLNYIEALIYGFIFGLAKYQHFNFWFQDFDPAAYAVAPGIQGLYFLTLFLLFRFFKKRFPKLGYLAVLTSWLSFEFFKSSNAVRFSYGVLAQTMYKTHHFTGIADIVGSYVLSLLIIFPGMFLMFQLTSKREKSKKEWFIPLIIYFTVFISSIIYTQTAKVDYSDAETLKVSLIQHNLNCWLSTENAALYIQAYDHLEQLSREGEAEGAELVIWPETAFVPAIEWHKKWRPSNERERLDLIKRMEKYLQTSDAYYIIGNNESFGKDRDKHYNSAYLYEKDQIVSKYRKINLVPFTEEFPFPDQFPWLLEYVQNLGAKQIEKGEEQTLFNVNGIESTILICYEDAFPELARESALNGSDLLINITNDAWTDYPATALQHIAAASLRTIETRRTLVRAGTSGYTSVIDPNGKVLADLPLFVKDQLTYDVPIYSDRVTIYTRYGSIIDRSGYILLMISLILAIVKLFRERVIDKKNS